MVTLRCVRRKQCSWPPRWGGPGGRPTPRIVAPIVARTFGPFHTSGPVLRTGPDLLFPMVGGMSDVNQRHLAEARIPCVRVHSNPQHPRSQPAARSPFIDWTAAVRGDTPEDMAAVCRIISVQQSTLGWLYRDTTETPSGASRKASRRCDEDHHRLRSELSACRVRTPDRPPLVLTSSAALRRRSPECR